MYFKEEGRTYSTVPNVTHLHSEGSLESRVLSSKEKRGTPLQKPKMINSKQVFIIGNGESRIDFDLERLRSYGKIYGCNLLYEEFTPDALVAIDDRIMHPCYWSGYPMDNVCWFRDWRPMPGEAYELLTDSSIISGDSAIDMSDYLYTNSRNDSTEFVMHGTHKDKAKEIEDRYRAKDADSVVEESAWNLVFKAGIYTSWLNNKGDKVKNIGAGSFPPEYVEDNFEIFKKFVTFGGERPSDQSLGLTCGPTAHLLANLIEKPDEIYFIGMDLYSNNDRVNNVYKGRSGYMGAAGNKMPPDEFIMSHLDLFNLFPNIKHFKVNKHPLGTDAINREVPEWKDCSNLEYLTYAEMFGRLAE